MSAEFDYRSTAQRVLDIEKAAIDGLYQYLDESFNHACRLMFHCQGKVIVTGMGKSGHIAHKIAATLASTGTPAFFVHPGEASHGDLGMIDSRDLVLALSNSGESEEIIALLPVLKRRGMKLVCMTGKPESTMAREADVHLCTRVEQEACPLGLAPTASTTATLAMGDALAVALLEARGFTADDFALSHPGGALGKRLLLRVADIMHKDERVPRVGLDTLIIEALLEIGRSGMGFTAVVDGEGRLAGIYTDGDLRRTLDHKVDVHNTRIAQVMTRSCTTVPAGMLAAEAVKLMEEKKISGLLVLDDDQRPIGAFNMHDLLRAGVI
ncbi:MULTISPECIES: KpsF/GutQ family sugar-phosphate isomerase [Oceanimonas]|uniref:Arabinose 5-phosphate isomerase n=1 Tax=Oceanimonas doudoroffii TaxID=84158 RepID=A0A233RCR6_9GAMM|nr:MULTISPECIES: KpsF/GutQ family sugar-phosphate isomerase [Oceanimonas]NHI01164.1 Arabinose 5-phosphate isomerase KdsD [Oceanimonas sp. MB9]OXY81188.1 D-arabinose 5-phosphate isomerase [Oceanimonas doudoroffii]